MPTIEFCSSQLLPCLYKNVSEMWRMKQLCDVEIQGSDGESIAAHRLVLSAISPYFRIMFTADLCESRQKSIKLANVKGGILATLVRFAYFAKLDISNTNVEALLAASNLLQIEEVEKFCCDFLQAQLCPSNCLGIWALAKHYHCRELSSFSFKFILKNFTAVCRTVEFSLLSFEDLKVLLNNESLSLNSEEEVFDAGMQWIQSGSEREAYLPEILNCVRFGSLTPDYLRNTILESNLVKDNVLCTEIVQNALEFALLPLFEKQKAAGICYNVSRISEGFGDQLFVVGGLNGNNGLSALEKYDMYTDSWSFVSDMPTSRYGFAVATLHGSVYCLGGCIAGLFLDTCECYNTDVDTWKSISAMSRPRKYFAAAQSHNRIFAIGGTDGFAKQKSVEMFDPNRNKWASCLSMANPRIYVGTATIGGLIYAVGGHNGVKRLKSVECYDVVKNSWLPVRSLAPDIFTYRGEIPPSERSVAGVASMTNVIYCVGGFDGSSHLKDACMYDPRLDKWMTIASMNEGRSSSCLVAMKDRLYALGGFNGQFLKSVEIYDPKANSWEAVPDMITTRAHFGACVV